MNGVERIAAERLRQLNVEGWTSEHDDQWEEGQLASAGACYACPPIAEDYWWPWDTKFWKPTDETQEQIGEPRIRELERAGALIAAEIDRLLRLEEIPR